jgi:hypothetical protein
MVSLPAPLGEIKAAVRKDPLNQRVLSLANARKTPPSPAENAELKPARDVRAGAEPGIHPFADEKGAHVITAGGRRLRALQELAAEGGTPQTITWCPAWSRSPFDKQS